MSERPVLVFDSGVGGLTVLREARVLMPDRRFVYVADDAGEFLATARDLLDTAPASVRVGATLVNDILVVRFMAADSQSLRYAFGEFWAGFRQAAAGLPAALPRLWHI